MTLDLTALTHQIGDMARHLGDALPGERQRAEDAARTLREQASRWEELSADAAMRAHSPAAARPRESLDRRYPAPVVLAEYVVIAADGSQIEPDRHGLAYCHLINVGRVSLRYGPESAASLDSRPSLGYRDEDLYLRAGNQWVPIEGHLLAMKRQVAELRELVSLADEAAARWPEHPLAASVVALLDGALTFPAIEGRGVEQQLRLRLLDEFLRCLAELRQRGIPIASYVSGPRASEVVNLLRIARCPYTPSECDRRCADFALPPTAACQSYAGLPDRLVFERLPLEPGERSGVFRSPWPTSVQRYGEHRVHLFYLNVGAEIVRVEVPAWVADDTRSLDRVHAVLLDQCRRGQGYPRALVEAHEQAVVRLADRRVFWELVSRQLLGQRAAASLSEKQQSKRLRTL
ncbi:MAG: DNA double-strand break repair nuclease NurA [Chloroflexi bacterium]|nr:DNA double-strand break repair nuclease NurA [Chloroflexota bacterium]